MNRIKIDPFLQVLQENNGPVYWLLPTPEDLRMTQEEIAYRLMLPDLLTQYENQFVAIYRGHVIDTGGDQVTLVRRVSAKYPDEVVLIRQVLDQPEPEIRVYSPRLEALP